MSEDTPDDEGLTTSTSERWEYTGTIVAIVTLLSLVTLVVGAGYGIFILSAIPQAWFLLYLTVCLMAATWVFGRGTLKAVQKFKS